MQLTERQQRLLRHTLSTINRPLAFLKIHSSSPSTDGLYYWDTDGKRYFDGIGGIFVATLGHKHPRLMEAMIKQMEQLSFAPPMHGTSDITLDFVEKVGSITPGDLNFVRKFIQRRFGIGVESALKFVRQYFKQTGHPSKYKFVSRYYGYHGATFGAMAASGTGKHLKSPFEPHLTGFVKVFPPSYYRDRFATWEECNRFCARMIEDVIIHEDPDTVAGVILEPIGNTGGIITPNAEYFQIIREICDKYNVALIFDEIITGYGRTGNMFAAQTFGVTPDIICGGKGLSSGAIPMGAMIARESMGDAFFGTVEAEVHFAHGHTTPPIRLPARSASP